MPGATNKRQKREEYRAAQREMEESNFRGRSSIDRELMPTPFPTTASCSRSLHSSVHTHRCTLAQKQVLTWYLAPCHQTIWTGRRNFPTT